MGRPSVKPPWKPERTLLGPLRLPGVIPVTHHLECLHCAYDLYGLAAEAYADVYRGARIAIRRMVRCPECGLLQRYLASAPDGRLELQPPALSPLVRHERNVPTAVVVAVLLLAAILVLVLISLA